MFGLKTKERPAQFNLIPHPLMLAWAGSRQQRGALWDISLSPEPEVCRLPQQWQTNNQTGQRLLIICPNCGQPQRAPVWPPSLTHSGFLQPSPEWPIPHRLHPE